MSSYQIQFRVNRDIYDDLRARGQAMRLSESQYARLIFLLGRDTFDDLDVKRKYVSDREDRRRAKRAQNQQQREADAY